MAEWKRVKIDFETMKLGDFIEPVKTTIAQSDKSIYGEVYGVTNTEGIVKTGKKASADISKYIIIDKNFFAYNPYRINVGSIGANFNGLKGCVSPAYVVFKTKEGLDPVFLWYYLKSDFGNHLINWYGNRGGVRNALRYDDLCKIDIPAISYEKQLEVIRKIDHYNNKKSKLYNELEKQEFDLKQLRQAILQEAVEGKLTAEWRKKNPELISGENHAARLLEKIKAEKDRLVKEGKIKKQKLLPPISEDEKPFALPDGWVWCRIGDFADVVRGGSPRPAGSPEFYNGNIPFLKVADITSDENIYLYKHTYTIKEKGLKKTRLVSPNTFMLTNSGATLGVPKICTFETTFNDGIQALLFLPKEIDIIFLYNFFKSKTQYLRELVFGRGQPNLNTDMTKILLFALPPVSEQHAIVEKVDRLMAKIDALEEQVKSRKAQAGQLMQAVLREAFNGD